jgi:hypothetical protein
MDAQKRIKRFFAAGLGAAAIAIAGCAGMMSTKHVNVSLSGSEQVPPVNTAARGNGSFTVKDDHSVSGSVTVSGLAAVAAHIHVGARGKNGPIAIGLNKSSDTQWVIPAGAKFNDDQYRSFLAGETYVNFHTAANKGGEIRAQLQP